MHGLMLFLLALMSASSFSALSSTNVRALDQCEITQNSYEETVADFLFRYKIVKRNHAEKSIFVDDNAFNDHAVALEWMWKKIKSKHLTSPLKIFVHYSSTYKTRLSSVKNDDVNQNADEIYHNVDSMRAYIDASLPEIVRVLRSNYQPSSMTFSETQKHTNFLKRTTLTNESVRICGLNDEIEGLLLSHLLRSLDDQGLVARAIFYFGSRVMPRSEVVKRDLRFANTMPINDDGVVKNAVRMRGLTEISDLEVMVIVSSQADYQEADLKMVGKNFKKEFAKVFNDFPISVRLLVAKIDEPLFDPFSFIERRHLALGKRALSPHQFVKANIEFIP